MDPNVSYADWQVSLPLKHWHHPLVVIYWLTTQANKHEHIMACAHVQVFLKSSFVSEAERREGKQEVQQTVFVWESTIMPVIYTLIDDAIPVRGLAALGGWRGEWERAPSWYRERLSAAVVRDKAESSQTPHMINDL